METINEIKSNFKNLYNKLIKEDVATNLIKVGEQLRWKGDYKSFRDDEGNWQGKYVYPEEPSAVYDLMVNDEITKPDLHDRNTYDFKKFEDKYVKYQKDGSHNWAGPSSSDKVENIISDKYKNSYWDWFFNGLPESVEEKHNWFMNQLDREGDNVILTHVSPIKIEDGGMIQGGTRQNYTSTDDKYKNYFWGSKVHGGDPSESGRYIYKCRVPIDQIYDYPCLNEKGYKSLYEAYENEPFVASWWPNGGGIVVVSRLSTKFFQRIDTQAK